MFIRRQIKNIMKYIFLRIVWSDNGMNLWAWIFFNFSTKVVVDKYHLAVILSHILWKQKICTNYTELFCVFVHLKVNTLFLLCVATITPPLGVTVCSYWPVVNRCFTGGSETTMGKEAEAGDDCVRDRGRWAARLTGNPAASMEAR